MTHIYIASCVEDGGIYHYILDRGALTLAETLPLPHPMYMTIDRDRLYCVLCHPFPGSRESGVVCVKLENGYFGERTAPVPTHGEEGCHLCVLDGRVYVANYTSGNLCCLPDITVQHHGCSIDPERQEGPHTHCTLPTPDGRFLCTADLGLDKILVYDRQLRPVSETALPAGSGPRHLLFSEDGTRLYCVNELRSGVSVFSYSDGVLTYLATHPVLPEDYAGENYPAAIRSYHGKLYVSNRGHDSIAYFAEGDAPAFVPTGGSFPRDFFIIDDTLLCAGERTDTVTVFRMENDTPVATDTVLRMKRPLAITGMVL